MTRNDRKPYPSPSAESIKAIIIDWLLNRHTNILIGNEIMYGSSRKVVDLLAICVLPATLSYFQMRMP